MSAGEGLVTGNDLDDAIDRVFEELDEIAKEYFKRLVVVLILGGIVVGGMLTFPGC